VGLGGRVIGGAVGSDRGTGERRAAEDDGEDADERRKLQNGSHSASVAYP
jgi:hypothetical protein